MSTTIRLTKLQIHDVKQEFNHLRSTNQLAENCGTACVNCGSEENVEYHHIVPIFLGGTNKFSNIVPLCYSCHLAAHNGQHVSQYVKTNKAGRKSNVSDAEAYLALDLLAGGEIGIRKCQELLGIHGCTQPKDCIQYKRWCADRGYKNVRNHLDTSITNGPESVKDGCEIGSIEYLDGRVEPIYFHDTGKNADVLYTFRSFRDKTPMTLADRLVWPRRAGKSDPKAANAWWEEYKRRYAEDVV